MGDGNDDLQNAKGTVIASNQEGAADIAVDQIVMWIESYRSELKALLLASAGADDVTRSHIEGELSAAGAIHLALQSRAYLLDLASATSSRMQ